MDKKVTLICIVTFIAVLLGATITGLVISYPDYKIKLKFGSRCTVAEICGDMTYIDCGMVEDGFDHYLDKDLKVIGTIGGICRVGECASGVPKEWITCIEKAASKK